MTSDWLCWPLPAETDAAGGDIEGKLLETTDSGNHQQSKRKLSGKCRMRASACLVISDSASAHRPRNH